MLFIEVSFTVLLAPSEGKVNNSRSNTARRSWWEGPRVRVAVVKVR